MTEHQMSIDRKNNYLGVLKAAIVMAHDCWPTHRGTIFVTEETEENGVAWEGPVELFALAGHEKARNCYAWQCLAAGGRVKILTVLENEFIDSASRAVQAAICADLQPPQNGYARGLELLRKRLQQSGSTLHEAQIKTEDLDVTMQALEEMKGRINHRRSMAN
jgi:hypothetical protein